MHELCGSNRARVRPVWKHNVARGQSILVVIASKEEWISRSLESILAPRSYLVRTTFTRAETLAQLEHETPDAVIVDELPDITALDFCRELREHHAITPSTPVCVVLSSPATRRDRLAAWRAGAWACLGDPLDAEELLAVLDALLPAKLDAEQARTTSLIDELTGVYNVRGVARRAQELGAQAARDHSALGCVLLAPDGGNTANGGNEERQLLRRIASSLKGATRISDAVGRLGPNAFIILAVDTDAAQAHRVGERLAQAVLSATPPGGGSNGAFKLFGGCHGVADFRTAAIDASELILRASAALARARAEPAGSWLRDFEEQR